MIHTRFSTPEMTVDDDPVVEVHESQLDSLRARANLAIPSGLIALLALALLAVGAWRVERQVGARQSTSEATIATMAAQIDALKTQVAARTDPARMADALREASTGTADAAATARRALSIAQRTEASLAPMAEQVAAVEGRLTNVQSGLDALSQSGTTQRTEIAKVSASLDALRTGQAQQLEAMKRQAETQDAQLGYQDKELSQTKKWTRIIGATTAATLGIVAAHTLGHGSR